MLWGLAVVQQTIEALNHFREYTGTRPTFTMSPYAPPSYHLNKDAIIADLKTERPQWPFSAYGPGRDAPRQLFGGFLQEQSMEEMRLLHYHAQASGNVQQVVSKKLRIL